MSNTKVKKNQDKFINLWNFFGKNKFYAISYIVLMFIEGVINFFTIILSAKFLEYLTIGEFDKCIMFILYATFSRLLSHVLGYIEQNVFIKLKLRMMNKLELNLTNRLSNISNDVYNSISTGVINRRVLNSPNIFFNNLNSLISGIISLLTTLISVFYIMFMNYIIAIIVIVLIIFTSLMRIVINKVDRKRLNEKRNSGEKLDAKIIESINANKDIKCLNMGESVYREIETHNQDYYKKSQNYAIVSNIIQTCYEIFYYLIIAAMLYVGVILFEQFFITYFALLFLFKNYNKINAFTWKFQSVLRQANMLKVEINRINQLFNQELMPLEKFGEEELNNFNGEIEFDNVVVNLKNLNLQQRLDDDLLTPKELKKKYKNQTQTKEIKDNIVLKNVSFKIQAGQKVAIVGKSGCGKSTLVSLLSKSLVCSEGDIKFDGKSINALTKDAIRDNVTVVNQFPYLYYMSIKDNIKVVKPNATDEEIMNVCDKANLTEFIKKLPNGLDTIIGENGIKLSGGQKQRLAIARAFLRDTKVIVFDESTSSLDNIAQKHIQNSIDNLENKTVIIVAHRLSTIKNCDKIIFIEDGKVEAQGSFDELLKTCEKFNNLYTLRRDNDE